MGSLPFLGRTGGDEFPFSFPSITFPPMKHSISGTTMQTLQLEMQPGEVV
jgi:hypothetical protein